MKKIVVVVIVVMLIIFLSGCPGIFNKFVIDIPEATISEGESLEPIDLAAKVGGGAPPYSFTLLEGVGEIADGVYTLSTDFTSAGDYTVRIMARDARGREAVAVFKVTVKDVNVAPKLTLLTPELNSIGIGCELLVLTWAATDFDNDPLKYDLYFGTNSEPGIFTNDLEETSFTMDSLPKGTTYYWKVKARDVKDGETTSPVYCFTTITDPAIPTPVSPAPSNAANDVSWNSITLSWEVAGDTEGLYYDIYFGKDEVPGLYRIGHDATELTISDLDRGKSYYWQIVVTDEPYSRDTGSGVNMKELEALALIRRERAATIGTVWSFNTKENQNPVEIGGLSPLDGFTYTLKDVLLTWNCWDPDGDDLAYDIYFGKNETGLTIYSSNIQENQFWLYSLLPGMKYYWHIVAKDGHGGSTRSEINEFSPRDIVKLTGGFRHSAAVNYDGTVLSWGRNNCGQLGNGSLVTANVPTATLFPGNIVDLSCGDEHTIALASDGLIYSAGKNNYGQLGIGTTSDCEPIPISVDSTYTFVKIVAGANHSLALTNTGQVLSWGYNSSGQLGNGTTANSSVPVLVTGLTNIVDISAGYNFSVALKSDGTVWAWGSSANRKLGVDSVEDNRIPAQITSLSNIVQISSGDNHSLALENDGTVWSWGENSIGQLGLGIVSSSELPSKLVKLHDINQVCALGAPMLTYGSSLALGNDGTVWAWGCNDQGQLGIGNKTSMYSPTDLGIYNISYIDGGVGFSLARKDDGTLWAWGNNGYGQLGDGTQENRIVPTAIK